jgi:hypothetical protein
MRIPYRAAILALTLPLLLAGCGDSMSRTFGLQRDAPDEFQVTTRAPLSMPPDFALRAPRPGAPRPQEQSARAAAEATLAPSAALAGRDAALTPGTTALLQAAGGPAPADVRSRVERESALERPSRTVVERLMFWRTPSAQPGLAIDPQREAQRLRENAALGQNVTEGDSRIIQPRTRSLFDRLF